MSKSLCSHQVLMKQTDIVCPYAPDYGALVCHVTNPKYRCCRSHCHIITGSAIIGVSEIVIMFLVLVQTVGDKLAYSTPDTYFAGWMAVPLLRIPVAILMLSVIAKNHYSLSHFVLPEFCAQAITSVFLLCYAVFCLVQFILAFPDSEDIESAITISVTATHFVVSILGASIQMWFASIIMRCFTFLSAKYKHDCSVTIVVV